MQNTYNIRNYVFLDLEPTPIHLIPNLTRIDFTGLEGSTFKHGTRVLPKQEITEKECMENQETPIKVVTITATIKNYVCSKYDWRPLQR